MVKVCSFSFFDEQRILTPKTGEPLAIACSDQYLFVAEEGCVLEVYPFTATEPIAQLRTVSPVMQLLYNPIGDCIVTLERKNGSSRMFGRVYFKWRQSSIDRPMRVTLISSLTQGLLSGGQSSSAEIVELPVDETSVSCVAVCTDSGRIAMGMDTKVRVFSLTPEYESGHVSSHSIEILLDVETSVCIRRVAVFGDYLAFISASEARVLKIALLNEAPPTLMGGQESEASSTTAGWESDQATSTRPGPPKVQLIDRSKETTIQTDSSYVSWSPSKVWEEERLSANNSLAASINQSHDQEPHPLYNRLRQAHCTNVETLALPAITTATQERTVERHPMEVLGPVEYIWGQPVEVRMEETTPATKCRVLTMLYRRFSASQTGLEGVLRRGATASLPVSSRRSQETEETGLHTIELVPVKLEDSQTVIGVSCFIGSRLHGYLYDVAGGCGLISSFSFMSDTMAVASDGHLFHALSQGSVETFSNRAMQAAVYNRPSTDSEHAKWLKQPCPRPNMDLTLMSSNRLIGGCCLATSRDYLVVLTKSGDAQPPTTGKWLLQSLRRPAVDPTWNIYILLKKDPLQLYQQFVEYGEAHKGTSPPMYQHMLSEGHVLLRNQLLQNSSLTASVRRELDRVLSNNCFSLGDSLCSESRAPNKIVVALAAKYFVMSGASIAKVVQHITSSYAQTKGPPYQVLLKYLSLVLVGAEVKGQLEPIAHTVLDLFAEHKPKQLSHVILTSSLGQLAPDHGLTLLTDHLQGAQKSHELFKGQLCQVLLLLRLERDNEARDFVRQIPEDFLMDWLKDNMAVVLDTNNMQLTALGKLLWSQRECCLLELIHHSFVSGHTSLEDSLAMIKDCDGGLANNTLLKGLLERLVLNKEHEAFRLPAALHLVDLLLARLVSTDTPRPPSSTPFSLYGNRHKWLDALPPFDGSTQTQFSQTVLQDLMQLQALLCSAELFPIEQVADHAHSQLERCDQDVVGGISLKLLTWPHIGRIREAILLALEAAPQVTVEVCLTYLPPDLASWRDLLALLLDTVLKHPHSLTHQTLYKAALEHVVTMTTPAEFLGLLPSNGAVKFFLPFIESSLQQYIARQLAGQLNSVT